MYYVLQLAKALLKYKNHSTKHLITEYEKFNNTSKYKWEKKKKKRHICISMIFPQTLKASRQFSKFCF